MRRPSRSCWSVRRGTRARGHAEDARFLFETADLWNASIERWTVAPQVTTVTSSPCRRTAPRPNGTSHPTGG